MPYGKQFSRLKKSNAKPHQHNAQLQTAASRFEATLKNSLSSDNGRHGSPFDSGQTNSA